MEAFVAIVAVSAVYSVVYIAAAVWQRGFLGHPAGDVELPPWLPSLLTQATRQDH